MGVLEGIEESTKNNENGLKSNKKIYKITQNMDSW